MYIKIQIKDGNKESSLELSEVNEIEKLAIIHNVFKLFNIETDFIGAIEDYQRIGKIYANFYKEMEDEPIEKKLIELDESKREEIKQKMLEGYDKESVEDQSDYLKTGIKIKDGVKTYRLHYHCNICNFKGNHYIPEDATEVKCHSCGVKLKVYPAHPQGFPNRDNFGNYYRAGEWKDYNLDWE